MYPDHDHRRRMVVVVLAPCWARGLGEEGRAWGARISAFPRHRAGAQGWGAPREVLPRQRVLVACTEECPDESCCASREGRAPVSLCCRRPTHIPKHILDTASCRRRRSCEGGHRFLGAAKEDTASDPVIRRRRGAHCTQKGGRRGSREGSGSLTPSALLYIPTLRPTSSFDFCGGTERHHMYACPAGCWPFEYLHCRSTASSFLDVQYGLVHMI